MPRSSKAHDTVSDAALRSLQALGARVREARLRRNWTQSITADKAGLSESSIKKVENGSARISISAYLAVLDVFGVAQSLDAVLAPGTDRIGEALARGDLRRRAREPRADAAADEWAF